MERLHLVCILLVILKTANCQRQFHTASEADVCNCHDIPNFTLPKEFAITPAMPFESVTFRLFTRSSMGDEGIQVETGNSNSLQLSGFNPGLPLTVITHGWIEATTVSDWIHPLKHALLRKANMNVILFDWSIYSSQNYSMAARSTKPTGELLADFLKFIKRSYPAFSGLQIHLIGHSMGAHVSGVAGHNFPGVGRITGLDPAGPFFECLLLSQRLDPSDVHFVDVIHTNGGSCSTYQVGIISQIGHQDFYVNGGEEQPNCAVHVANPVFELLGRLETLSCHHRRAVQYFQESINSQGIPYGFYCSNYETFKTGRCLKNRRAAFGYHATPEAMSHDQGPLTFFLKTQGESYFLQKHLLIGVRVGSIGDRTTQGHLKLLVNIPSVEPQVIILIKNGTVLQTNKLYTGMAVFPLMPDVNSMMFTLEYEDMSGSFISVPTLQNIFIDILGVQIADTNTYQQYCVALRESIFFGRRINRRPRNGSC